MCISRIKKNKKKKITTKIMILIIFIVIGFLSAILIKSKNSYIKDSDIQKYEKLNIVVLGSEPEAITAAVTAARLGYKVDMITKDDKLGGLFTKGMLTALDLNYINSNQILHKGFFEEFYNHASNGHNLDLEKTQNFFNEVTKHKNIHLVKGVDEITPIVEELNEKKAVGVSYKKGDKVVNLEADFIFDGSYEAEFTRKMGAKYRTGRSEFGQREEYAAAGVMFSVNNVDWDQLTKAIKSSKNPGTGVTGNAAWGFKEMYNYVPQNDIFKMRGLNISKQDNGSIILNALLVLGIDPLDKESYINAIELSKKEIPYIVKYMNEHLVGFENAKLDKIAQDLYIREGVRILGKYKLTGYDIIAHTQFEDVISYGSYPSDLQTTHKNGFGNAQNGRSVYEIPLSVMMPKEVENVVVLGRCASFDVVSHGSARTVPVLMSMAQGVVHAVDYALSNNLSLENVRENHMNEVHKEMKEMGKMKMLKMPKNPYEGEFTQKYIKHLRIRGVLSSKYTKVIPLNEPASLSEASSIVNMLIDHSDIKFTLQQIESLKHLPEIIDEKGLVKFVSILIDKKLNTLEDVKNEGVIDEQLYKEIKIANRVNNSHMYGVLSEYINFVQPNFKEQIKTEQVNVLKINK